MDEARATEDLNRYWDAVVGRAEPPAGDLAGEEVATVDWLHATYALPAPDPAFARRLWTNLMQQATLADSVLARHGWLPRLRQQSTGDRVAVTEPWRASGSRCRAVTRQVPSAALVLVVLLLGVGVLHLTASVDGLLRVDDRNTLPAVDLFRVVEGPNGPSLAPLNAETLADLTDRPTIDLGAPHGEWSAAFSGDGTTLAVFFFGGWPGTIIIRDARTGAERIRFPALAPGQIVALSRDGTRVVVHRPDRGWQLFDTRDGRLMAETRPDDMPSQYGDIFPRAIDADAVQLYRLVPSVDPARSLAELSATPAQLIAYDLTKGVEIGRVPLPGVLAGRWWTSPDQGRMEGEFWPGLAVSPDGDRVAIVQADRDAVTLVDARRLAVERTITFRRPPAGGDQQHGLSPAVPERRQGIEGTWGTTFQGVFAPGGTRLYVYGVMTEQDTFRQRGLGLKVIDVASGEIVAEDLRDKRISVHPSAEGRNVYVTGRLDDDEVEAWLASPSGAAPEPDYILERLDAATLEPRAERLFDDWPAILFRPLA